MTLQVWRCPGGVWVALAVALLVMTGCSDGSDSSSGSDPTSAPTDTSDWATPDTTPPDSTDDVGFTAVLRDHFQPAATSCAFDESELPRAPEMTEVFRVCRPSDGSSSYVRLVNLSTTTLVFDVGPGYAVETSYPEKETELAQGLFGEISVHDVLLYGGYLSSGTLYLPARLSATIADRGDLTSIPFVADVQHGVAVSHSRALSDLVDQLPYAKLSSIRSRTAHGAACVLESLKRLNDGELSLQDAVNGAKACRALVDDLRQWWATRYADDIAKGVAPEAIRPPPESPEAVLKRLTGRAAAADSTVDDIVRNVVRGAATIR